MKNLIFFDTETTGKDPEDVLCQLAFKSPTETFCELYNPGKPIPPEASAVHHISNKMVVDKPAFRESSDYARIKELFESDDTIVVAHNCKFDRGMLAKEDIIPAHYICTLRVARALDTKGAFKRYNLQFLRYALEFDIEAQAHDALGDVMILEVLFGRLLDALVKETGSEESAIEKMIEISSRPSIFGSFDFGKYSGKTLAEVAATDRGYLEWLLKAKLENEAEEEDWVYTLRHYLGML